MLSLKKIDVVGQLLLIIGFTIFAIFAQGSFAFFLYGYFAVGGWQVISMLIHWLGITEKPVIKARKYYQIFILILLIVTILWCMSYFLADNYSMRNTLETVAMGFLFFMLYISPIAALWYLWISYRELRIWRRNKSVDTSPASTKQI